MGWKMQWHLLGLFSDLAKVVQREVSFKVQPWEQPGPVEAQEVGTTLSSLLT